MQQAIKLTELDIKDAISDYIQKHGSTAGTIEITYMGSVLNCPVTAVVEITEPQPDPEPLYPLRSEVYWANGEIATEKERRDQAIAAGLRYFRYGSQLFDVVAGICVCDQTEVREDEKSPGSLGDAGAK